MNNLKERVNNFIPQAEMDAFVIEALKEAIAAAEAGNFGVGAILVHKEAGRIVLRGQNKVFGDSRSDLHAEMDLINTWETEQGAESRERLQDMILITSLESCPMCLCRLITAGVPEVYHVADDEIGGMVHLMHQLPPVWQEIAKGRIYKKADCSPELSEIGLQIFLKTKYLNEKL
ncbi:MAG: nucleoside deaminase [Deltaproteobacteria bacterium]